MRIRIRARGGYGDRFGVHHEEGSMWDAPDDIAVKLLGHGFAVAVREPVIERATVRPPEKTARKRKGAK